MISFAHLVNIVYFLNMKHDSPNLSRTERKRQRKRADILDASMRLLLEGGIHHVTVHRIANAMDLTVGALYRYFPSKDALNGALTRRVLEDCTSSLTSALTAAEGTLLEMSPGEKPVAALSILAFAYEAFAKRFPGHFYLITEMMTKPGTILPGEERQSAMLIAFQLLDVVEAHIQAAQDQGAFHPHDARQRTLMYWSALHGSLQLYKFSQSDPQQVPAGDLTHAIAETLLSTWASDPELVRPIFSKVRTMRKESLF